MRAAERMDLLEKVGAELQARYTYVDIDAFFSALGISTTNVDAGNTNSKRVYAKGVLARVPESELLRVASELDLLPVGSTGAIQYPPLNWKDTKAFRLFISHISKDKQIANRLKDALAATALQGLWPMRTSILHSSGKMRLNVHCKQWMPSSLSTQLDSRLQCGPSKKLDSPSVGAPRSSRSRWGKTRPDLSESTKHSHARTALQNKLPQKSKVFLPMILERKVG